jgi:hypothetical protein
MTNQVISIDYAVHFHPFFFNFSYLILEVSNIEQKINTIKLFNLKVNRLCVKHLPAARDNDASHVWSLATTTPM